MAERDFNLEMTGEQVKDALQQLEDRVAEGWAVGEHDGVPVSSGSPYFENNSKWWAQQSAVSAAAAAESASTAEAEVEEGVRQGIVGAYVQETATPGAIVTIDDGADNIPLKDLKVNLAINQPGTGDPSPSNVRHIYPVTEAEVSRTGKNLFWAILGQTINPDTGEFIVADNSSWRTGLIAAEGSSAITLSIVDRSTMTTGSIVMHQYDENKQYIGYVLIGYFHTVTVDTRTLNAQTKYIALNGYQNGGASGILTAKIQLELGSTATAYEPYAGQQYVIDFGDNVVYGGELDITTGVLTAKYASVDLGTLSWSYTNGTFYTGGISSSAKANGSSKCSIYKSSSSGADKTIFIGSGGVVYAYDADYTSAASFKTAMSGVQLVYELATPISIQLDPTEVNTLRGDNVIFCDAGDITNCEYRADLKMYIDKVVGA